MAVLERREEYTNAAIDTSDMTISEYTHDGVRIYNLFEILERWDGVPDIEISIRQRTDLPGSKE